MLRLTFLLIQTTDKIGGLKGLRLRHVQPPKHIIMGVDQPIPIHKKKQLDACTPNIFRKKIRHQYTYLPVKAMSRKVRT